jgi:hypothetical protein
VNISNWLSKAENFTIRNNTFEGDMTIQPSSVPNMIVAGNLGAHGSCKSGVQYVRNVWSKIKCGATDRTASSWLSQVTDRGAHDWRLRPGAAAIDAADPGMSPALDRDGKARVGAPDAGAHEYGDPPPSAPGGSPSAPGGAPAGAFGLARTSFTRKRICRNPSRRCKRTTTLRVRLTGPGRVTVRLKRKGHRGRTFVRNAGTGVVRIRLNARKLARGRYKVRVTASDGAGVKAPARVLRLRVR